MTAVVLGLYATATRSTALHALDEALLEAGRGPAGGRIRPGGAIRPASGP